MIKITELRSVRNPSNGDDWSSGDETIFECTSTTVDEALSDLKEMFYGTLHLLEIEGDCILYPDWEQDPYTGEYSRPYVILEGDSFMKRRLLKVLEEESSTYLTEMKRRLDTLEL